MGACGLHRTEERIVGARSGRLLQFRLVVARRAEAAPRLVQPAEFRKQAARAVKPVDDALADEIGQRWRHAVDHEPDGPTPTSRSQGPRQGSQGLGVQAGNAELDQPCAGVNGCMDPGLEHPGIPVGGGNRRQRRQLQGRDDGPVRLEQPLLLKFMHPAPGQRLAVQPARFTFPGIHAPDIQIHDPVRVGVGEPNQRPGGPGLHAQLFSELPREGSLAGLPAIPFSAGKLPAPGQVLALRSLGQQDPAVLRHERTGEHMNAHRVLAVRARGKGAQLSRP